MVELRGVLVVRLVPSVRRWKGKLAALCGLNRGREGLFSGDA